jgi:Secretion system C-terminal sorting domain
MKRYLQYLVFLMPFTLSAQDVLKIGTWHHTANPNLVSKNSYTTYSLGNNNGAPWEIQNVDMPVEMKPALDAAVLKWQQWIQSPKPVKIRVQMADLALEVLAGTDYQLMLHNGFWYPSSLGKQLGTMPVSADTMDIAIYFNRKIVSSGAFYLGTDAQTPDDKFDLVTLILHELGHGLGFASSIRTFGALRLDANGQDEPCVDEKNRFCYGFKASSGQIYPMKFDSFLKRASFTAEHDISAYDFLNQTYLLPPHITPPTIIEQPSSGNPTQYSNVAFFKGNTNRLLYSPPVFTMGSSYHHFLSNRNIVSYDSKYTADEFMIFDQGEGRPVHNVTNGLCSLLQDLGWQLTQACQNTFIRIEYDFKSGSLGVANSTTNDIPCSNLGGRIVETWRPYCYMEVYNYSNKNLVITGYTGNGLDIIDMPDQLPNRLGYLTPENTIINPCPLPCTIYPNTVQAIYFNGYAEGGLFYKSLVLHNNLNVKLWVQPKFLSTDFRFNEIIISEFDTKTNTCLGEWYSSINTGIDKKYCVSAGYLSDTIKGFDINLPNLHDIWYDVTILPDSVGTIRQGGNLTINNLNRSIRFEGGSLKNSSSDIKPLFYFTAKYKGIPDARNINPGIAVAGDFIKSNGEWDSRIFEYSPLTYIYTCGDANSDGIVNQADVDFVTQAYLNDVQLPLYQQWAANVSGNSYIGSRDIGLLFRKARGGPGKWLCVAPTESKTEATLAKNPTQTFTGFPLNFTYETHYNTFGGIPGQPVTAVMVQSLGRAQSEILEFTLESNDPNILEFIGLADNQVGTLAEKAFVKVKKIDGRKMTILVVSAEPLLGSGTLVRLKSRTKQTGNIQITSSPIEVNETRIIQPPPPSTVTVLSGAELPQTEGLIGVYPNPVSQTLQVQYYLHQAQSPKLCIYNVLGQIVQCESLAVQESGEQVYSLDSSRMASGLYWVSLETDSQRYQESFIKVE